MSTLLSPIVRGVRSPLAPIYAMVFGSTAALGMVWTVLAVYTSSMGASAAVAGVVMAAYGGARVVVSVPVGGLSERFGRKALMLAGLCFLATGAASAALSTDIWFFAVALLVQGVGSAAFSTSALAATADLSSAEIRVRDMSTFQAVSMAGITLGPGLGGFLTSIWGYNAPFWFQGLVALVSLGLLQLVPARSRKGRFLSVNADRRNTIGLMRALAAPVSMAYASEFVRIACNWTLIPLIATSVLGLGMQSVGTVLTLGALSTFAVLRVTPRISARIGRRKLVIGASVISLAAIGSLSIATTFYMLAFSSILIGISSALTVPPLISTALDGAREGETGPTIGLMRFANDVALTTGPIAVGMLVAHTSLGYDAGLLGSAALVVIITSYFALDNSFKSEKA